MKRNELLTAMLIMASVIATNTAQAQDVLEIPSDAKAVTAEQAGEYYCVKDAWKTNANETYLLAMPSDLNGYYFGPDAKRLKVTSYEKQEDGSYVVTTEEMADLDDFVACQAYLVTPTLTSDSICHITPGIKTEAKATEEGKELLYVPNPETTAVDEVLTDVTGKPSCVYDIQGRKVSNIKKGETYIIKGKKVIIK